MPPQDLRLVPLRFDSLLLILCTSGTGKIEIDLNEYDILPDTLITINPRNYISLYDCSPDMSSRVIVCSHEVVEEVLPKLTDLLPIIMHNRQKPVRRLDHQEADSIDSYFSMIKTNFEAPHTPFLKKKMMCILQALLFEILEINHHHDKSHFTINSRKEEIMAHFILYVSKYFTVSRQVGFYADKLCITSKHLSAVVKEMSGRTAGEWIDTYVLLEAKMMLKTTDLTVQEISSRLNFANQSFFGKYFKHHTGYPPTIFRSKFGH